jgi:hypothetical protein
MRVRPVVLILITLSMLLLGTGEPAQAASWMDVVAAYRNAKEAISEMPDCQVWIRRNGTGASTVYEIVQRCGQGNFTAIYSRQVTDHFNYARTVIGWCEAGDKPRCEDPNATLHIDMGSTIYGGGGGTGEWGCVLGLFPWGPITEVVTTIDCIGKAHTSTDTYIGQATSVSPVCQHPAQTYNNACYDYDAVLESLPMDPPSCVPPPEPPAPADWVGPCDCVPWGTEPVPTGEDGVCLFGKPAPPVPPTDCNQVPPPAECPGPGRGVSGGTSGGTREGSGYSEGTVPFTPILTGVTPATAIRGAHATQVTLTGQYFYATSMARWNGVEVPTVYQNATTLLATIPSGDLAAIGVGSITVVTPRPTTATRPAGTLVSGIRSFQVVTPFILDPLVQNGREVVGAIRWSLPVENGVIDCGTTPVQAHPSSPARCGYGAAGTYTVTGTHSNGDPNTVAVTIPGRPVQVEQLTTTVNGRDTDGISTSYETPDSVQIQLHLTDDSGGQTTIQTTVDLSTLP